MYPTTCRQPKGARGLDSKLMRDVLALIQHAQLRGQRASVQGLAHATGRSASVIAGYVQALRMGGLIDYEDGKSGTLRVTRWL